MLIREGAVLLEWADLVNDRCLTVAAYKHGVADGLIVVRQKGGHNHPALIEWSSLPERYKELVRAHMGGDPEQLALAQEMERHMELRADDERYIDEFRAGNGYMLTEERRRGLKRAARVMAFLAELADMPAAQARARFGRPVMELKAKVLDYVKANKVPLPGSFARLEARKRAYLQARATGLPGASALVHGGHGNANCSKVVDPLQQGVLEMLASQHQNLSLRQLATQYNLLANFRGWPTLTPNTIRAYLGKGSVSRTVTFFAKGASAYQEKHGIVVHRSRPTRPTYLWVHDATTYELYYQRPADRQNKAVQWLRKQVCVVLDPHSWYPVGYAIGEVDNVELTRAAVRSAVAHMQQLTGHYVLPYQVQSDRLGHKELGTWYEDMGVTYTPAKARNSRAKVIEPYFNHHHRTYVQPYYPNWGGHNVDSLKRNQPNPDALERLKRHFPDEAGVVAQIHEAFARERADKEAEFLAGLNGMESDTLRVVGRSRFLELFGQPHTHRNELTNRGLCPTLLGEERVYNLLDLAWQEHVGTSFQVLYDPDDLSSVLAISPSGKQRYLLPEVAAIPMALADHTPVTRAALAAVEGFKRELGQAALDRRESSAERARLVAARLLDLAVEPAATTPPPAHSLAPTPAEEVVQRAYVTVGGSHKAAQRRALLQRIDPEKWAEDQL